MEHSSGNYHDDIDTSGVYLIGIRRGLGKSRDIIPVRYGVIRITERGMIRYYVWEFDENQV